MNADAVPELRAKIEAAAALLRNSAGDHVVIEGADNKILVKSGSATARKMAEENRLLFPQSVEGNHYLVCIAVPR